MPRVQQYQSNQIETRIASSPRAQASPEASFGAPLGQGISNLSNSLQQEKDRLDNADAQEALVKFERDKNNLFFNPDNGYFNTQGRDAFDGAAGINESLDKLKRIHSEKLKSAKAQQSFNRVADKHITNGRHDIDKHSSRHLKAWEISTINSQVENTLENASLYWNDKERLDVQLELGRQSILDAANLSGDASEVTAEKLQTYESSFAKSSIVAATQNSSSAGEEGLKQWGNKLEGPDLVKIKDAIEKKKKTEKIQQDAQIAVLKSGNLIDSFGDQGNARSLILEEVNKIDDPELRSSVMRESMWQLQLKQNADSESRAATFEQAENYIVEGGSVENFKLQNPGAWEDLTAKQKRILTSGKPVSTDYVLLSKLLTLPKEKLAQVNPTNYFTKLATADRMKLVNAVKSATNGTPDAQVGRSRLSQTSLAVTQLFGDKLKWESADVEKVNAFYSIIDAEVSFIEQQKGSPLNSQEYTQVLNGMTRKVVKEGFVNLDFAFGFGNSEVDISGIDADILRVTSDSLRKDNIPSTAENILARVKNFRAISDFLKRNNESPTPENILKAFEQATK